MGRPHHHWALRQGLRNTFLLDTLHHTLPTAPGTSNCRMKPGHHIRAYPRLWENGPSCKLKNNVSVLGTGGRRPRNSTAHRSHRGHCGANLHHHSPCPIAAAVSLCQLRFSKILMRRLCKRIRAIQNKMSPRWPTWQLPLTRVHWGEQTKAAECSLPQIPS